MAAFHFEDLPFELIINQASLTDPALDRQGSYTRGDLDLFPAWKRVQLIDGYLLLPPPVPAVHQCIITELLYQWTQYIKEKSLPLKAVSAPYRFSRPEDDRTTLLPDLAVITHPGSILCPDVPVLPDFVAEVATRGTTCLDHTVKLRIYRDWGVREYWIIDPQTSCVELYSLQEGKEELAGTYQFGARIPVRTYPGLTIDTSEFLRD